TAEPAARGTRRAGGTVRDRRPSPGGRKAAGSNPASPTPTLHVDWPRVSTAAGLSNAHDRAGGSSRERSEGVAGGGLCRARRVVSVPGSEGRRPRADPPPPRRAGGFLHGRAGDSPTGGRPPPTGAGPPTPTH